MGAGVATMTPTINEIGRIRSEIVDTRRMFRWHWMVPHSHLVRPNRIIRFAVHSLKRHKAKAIETLRQDLLTGRLSSELTVRLHCKYLTFHPGFDFI